MIKCYELTPVYDKVKSFGKKAYVEYRPVYDLVARNDGSIIAYYEGEKVVLKSYGREVCAVDPATNNYVLYGQRNNIEDSPFTATTRRHIREFLKQFDIPAGAWKQIYNDAAGIRSCGKWIRGGKLPVELKSEKGA